MKLTLGEKYAELYSGFTGTCVGIHTYLHSSQRVTLAGSKDGAPFEVFVDASALVPVDSQ